MNDSTRTRYDPTRPGPPEWVFREIAYYAFCNKKIMKIGTRAPAAENPCAWAARTLLIYFAVTKGIL